MTRAIQPRVDKLYVEGTDDGAFVNALVLRCLGVDIAAPRLVAVRPEGGGDDWAIRQFGAYVEEAPTRARVGLIVDRDNESNDKWPRVRDRLKKLDLAVDDPLEAGAIASGRFGIWMWPDNVAYGTLEHLLQAMLPLGALMEHARESSRTARSTHAAEYREDHLEKATLKIRSVWRDATTAGGYGHLVRELPLTQTPASVAFLKWFTQLFLTE